MSKKRTKSKYQRCKVCNQLVMDAAHCANCKNSNPLSLNNKEYREGKRKSPTLDTIENGGQNR